MMVVAVVVGVLLLGLGGVVLFKSEIKAKLMGKVAEKMEGKDDGELMTAPTPAPVPTPSPLPSAVTPSTGSGAMMEEVVVTFNGEVFSPATVTIKKGTVVKFKNTGTGHMEVASAIHPTHQVYPEFDQGKDAAQVDKNEYDFLKP